ncbi:hypothetical protein F1643_13790 [Azospirillum sp. INR13]|nr:hypothetical protein [Azospirillum sp. INR13]MBF5095360.1 hypothetical protein [Azospirillum sp. INR13]
MNSDIGQPVVAAGVDHVDLAVVFDGTAVCERCAAGDRVDPVAAVDDVHAAAAIQQIVAHAAVDGVVAGIGADRVVEVRPGKAVVAAQQRGADRFRIGAGGLPVQRRRDRQVQLRHRQSGNAVRRVGDAGDRSSGQGLAGGVIGEIAAEIGGAAIGIVDDELVGCGHGNRAAPDARNPEIVGVDAGLGTGADRYHSDSP